MENDKSGCDEKKCLLERLLFDAGKKPRSWVPTSIVSILVLSITLFSNYIISERQNRLQVLKLVVELLPNHNSKTEQCRIKLEKQVQSLALALDENYGSSTFPNIDTEGLKLTFSECQQSLVAIEALMKASNASGNKTRQLRQQLEGFNSFISNETQLRLNSSTGEMAVPAFTQAFLTIKRDWIALASTSLDSISF